MNKQYLLITLLLCFEVAICADLHYTCFILFTFFFLNYYNHFVFSSLYYYIIFFCPGILCQILRNVTLASLYEQLGFKRKAAFFRRVGGMHCVSPDSPVIWPQCYDLLLQCLSGYGLSVDPKDVRRGRTYRQTHMVHV